MDDLLLLETLELIRTTLEAQMPELPQALAGVVRADYRTDGPAPLQEALAYAACGLDSRRPAEARAIQKKIAFAEACAPGVPAGSRTNSWVIQESALLDAAVIEQDGRLSRAFRYLSLPAEASDEENPAARTRFGAELARTTNLRQAMALARRRLPVLKPLTAMRFLAMIGYPAPVPAPDCLRLAKYLGMIPAATPEAEAASYVVAIQRAARLAELPLAQVGYLFQLYSGDVQAPGSEVICPAKRPRCGVCPLTSRCSYVEAAPTAPRAAAPQRSLPVKEWSAEERPRERMLSGERLSNTELLAIILRTGSGRLSAVELARELLNTFGTLHDLDKASPHEIVDRMQGMGIGPAKAVEICAALELGRRVAQPAADTRLGLRMITSSRDVFELCRPRYKASTQEEFLLLVLNSKNRVQKEVPVSLGTLDTSLVHPRDVFRPALKEAAAAVIFVHNHPSGDPRPSENDVLLTARLIDAGKLLGVQVIDHVIIGSHEWYSFRDHGRMQ